MANQDLTSFQGKIGRTLPESKPWWPEKPNAPAKAPDILFVVLDDVGFSDLGCYGSEIDTPNIDALAANGLRYNNFHVAPMCSPTRASLLTGRNSHAVGMGIISEWSGGYPGYRGRISKNAGTIAEILGENGYSNYISGKWHLTNLSDYGAAGPFDQWPLGRGFHRWYGFHGAMVDQWHPDLFVDNHPIHHEPGPDYHLSADLIDHAIEHVRDHVTASPDRPFFQYLGFAACHWPLQAPAHAIEKYKGRYDAGWDAIRAERLARQKQLGIVPADTELAPRNDGVAAWDDLSEDRQRLAARFQETYAAFLDHTDCELGRLIDYLKNVGRYDNTLIVLLSDNGASAEGGETGAVNMRRHMTHQRETLEESLAQIDKIGSELSYCHYPHGWAQVSNTPLKWYKKDSHGGGIRSPLIVQWPNNVAEKGGVRSQFHHVIDIVPTVLSGIGIDVPETLNGREQMPMHGKEMGYSFGDSAAASPHAVQYFEIMGDRALWKDGWKLVARHSKGMDFDDDRWELYNVAEDFAECKDLAAEHPDMVSELLEQWWHEAERFNVLPIDDREFERAYEQISRNPVTKYRFLPDQARMDRLTAPELRGRDYLMTARLNIPDESAEGVILSWGSRFAGLSLYAKDGMLFAEYVLTEAVSFTLRAVLPTGEVAAQLAFVAGKNNSGILSLRINGQSAGSVTLPNTWSSYSTTSGVTCGLGAVPVSENYQPPFRFSGTIREVLLEFDAVTDSIASKAATVFRDQ